MDPVTASYYRAILFLDGQSQWPLPPTLVLLHAWTLKRGMAMGLGGMITKATALSVALTWLSSTKEGRAFALEFTSIGDLFYDQDVVNWDAVDVDSKVVVMVDEKPTAGEFIRRRGGSIDVRLGEDTKTFKTSKVKLAGA